MVKIIREFCPADRYLYDFKLCTIANGWAQIDTSQDARYYGNWINPKTRQLFCYCEGDLILTKCDTDEELASEVLKMRDWNVAQGHRFIGIDPGFNEALKAQLDSVGLGELTH